MCGLAGIHAPSLPTAQREAAVRSMLEVQRSRGPDGSRVVSAGPFSLGFARLTIVGGPGVDQPIEDGHLVTATVGEIYNHHALAEQYGEAAPRVARTSDCGVVPLVARAEGPGFVARLDGIFSGAVYDVARDRVVLFRDHVGVKPLHWCMFADGIAFASATSALLKLHRPRFDRRRLRSYLATGYVEGASTLLEGVRDVPPGSIVRFDGGSRGVRTRRWFDPSPRDGDGRLSVRALVEQAVATETPETGVVHTCLSGGIDSTITTLLAARRRPDLTALTVVYEGRGDDPDARHARAVATAHGIAHEEVEVHWRHYLEALEDGWAFDQPIGDPNALAFARLCRRVAEAGGRVLLSGDGADELFCGYPYYRRGVQRRVRSFAAASTFASMLTPDDRAFVRRLTGLPPRPPLAVVRRSPLVHMQIRDLAGWFEANLLAKADRFGMAHSVEVRVPFVRPAVVRAALALPDAEKVQRRGESKLALRRQFAALLPGHVLERPKAGFPCPLDDWLAGDLGRALAERADGPVADGWDEDAERRLWAEHLSRTRNWGQQLWRLAVLRAWWRSIERWERAPWAASRAST
jgi:asparagine synthase (glutamine-hydrolysing)